MGVNKVVSTSDSKPPEQQKGKKRLSDATGVVKDKICPARQSVYTKCKKVGLYASVCKIKPGNDSATGNKSSDRKRELLETKCLEEVVEDDMEDDVLLGIFTAKDSGKDGHTPIFVLLMLD